MEVKLLNNNRIITLLEPGKMPIKSSSGLFFYSPADLLCASIGACIGREIVTFSSREKIDVELFQLVQVTSEDNKIVIFVQCPLIDEKKEKELTHSIENCEMVVMIKKAMKVEVSITSNTMSEADLRGVSKSGRCCGQ